MLARWRLLTLIPIALVLSGCGPRSTDPAGDPWVTSISGRALAADDADIFVLTDDGVVMIDPDGVKHPRFGSTGPGISQMSAGGGRLAVVSEATSQRRAQARVIDIESETTLGEASLSEGSQPLILAVTANGITVVIANDGSITTLSPAGTVTHSTSNVAMACDELTGATQPDSDLLVVGSRCDGAIYKVDARSGNVLPFVRTLRTALWIGAIDRSGRIFAGDDADRQKLIMIGPEPSQGQVIALSPPPGVFGNKPEQPMRISGIASTDDGRILVVDDEFVYVTEINADLEVNPKFATVQNCPEVSTTIVDDSEHLVILSAKADALCRVSVVGVGRPG